MIKSNHCNDPLPTALLRRHASQENYLNRRLSQMSSRKMSILSASTGTGTTKKAVKRKMVQAQSQKIFFWEIASETANDAVPEVIATEENHERAPIQEQQSTFAPPSAAAPDEELGESISSRHTTASSCSTLTNCSAYSKYSAVGNGSTESTITRFSHDNRIDELMTWEVALSIDEP
ncbi:hypothetical protein SEMRO_209_G087230.1 [Seminavis robusta]|uniref:Uncharacterized protein n=1 Tax=Seminavis robusta TaxID=568900 RepID=A0A9N8H889_9STRA|nr:hypothetical protein SEMRO_209_G087230.1 [Seminavis robusta]|eukprot:Sro209_g087230.1 n/a (177) ;mRNA; f:3653-4183